MNASFDLQRLLQRGVGYWATIDAEKVLHVKFCTDSSAPCRRPDKVSPMTDEPNADQPTRRRIDDPAALKALAHPLRLRILRHLGVSGPATSTTLARALGENTGTLSYHLRQLERGGFIEDIPDHAVGRERWWRGVRNLDVRRPPRDTLTAEERETTEELDGLRLAEDMELSRRYVAGRSDYGAWAQGSRGLAHMTQEELQRFHDEYLDLLNRYGHTAEDAPPDARPILLRWFALPAEEE